MTLQGGNTGRPSLPPPPPASAVARATTAPVAAKNIKTEAGPWVPLVAPPQSLVAAAARKAKGVPDAASTLQSGQCNEAELLEALDLCRKQAKLVNTAQLQETQAREEKEKVQKRLEAEVQAERQRHATIDAERLRELNSLRSALEQERAARQHAESTASQVQARLGEM